MPMRIRPFVSSRLYARRRSRNVDTSAPSQFDPSLVRKIGSRPSVSSNRSRSSSGVIVHACAGRWQVKQVRPFVPRSWKNGFVLSIEGAVAGSSSSFPPQL